jgi:hypothetical protein
LTTKIQDDIFLKKIFETIIYKIDPSQPKLTFQILDLDHETIITSNKANQNKLCSSILNKSIVK